MVIFDLKHSCLTSRTPPPNVNEYACTSSSKNSTENGGRRFRHSAPHLAAPGNVFTRATLLYMMEYNEY